MEINELTANKLRLRWWPSPQDYNEAVQTPAHTYCDPELAAGQVELNALGLPRPQSGNFATVYKVDCVDRSWAVRCFLRNVPGQSERYAVIEQAIRALGDPHLVDFFYIEEGMRLRGDWFPVVKMQWADGLPLVEFIRENLSQPAQLRAFAEKFKSMILSLHSHGIAHGDLQHGNIIVTDGVPRLVDYDGMFVPSLAGQPASELGHPNYQHPSRNPQHFDRHLDNFSSWIIYASIVCLSEDPALFGLLDVGDDCLLFRQKDFIQPRHSSVFRLLEDHPNPTIVLYARWIRSLLLLPLQEVPELDVDVTEQPSLSPLERVRAEVARVKAPPTRRAFKLTPAVWFLLIGGICATMWWNQQITTQETSKLQLASEKASGLALTDHDREQLAHADAFYQIGGETALKSAIEILHHYPETQSLPLADCWHKLGHYYSSRKSYPEALNCFKQAQHWLHVADDESAYTTERGIEIDMKYAELGRGS